MPAALELENVVAAYKFLQGEGQKKPQILLETAVAHV
jgi:hypothetical protein